MLLLQQDSPSFGQLIAFNLRKVAIYSLLLSHGSLRGALADDNPMEAFIHALEHDMGIASDDVAATTGSTSTLISNTATANHLTLTGVSLPAVSTTSLPQTNASIPMPTILPSNGTSTNTNGTSTITNGITSAQPRAVFAHVIVGNNYIYSVDNWSKDIALAASKGIDAFALNVGADAWEATQVANAFSAASKYNSLAANARTPFKLFLSFDMSSLPCNSASDARLLQTYIRTYANNTSQFKYNGRVFVSTFAGEACTFGVSAGGLDRAWTSALRPNASVPAVWFVPSFFVDPATFRNFPVIDGAFHWNSGWPMGNNNITFAPDQSYISNLGVNKTYMAAASPWFFAHYGPDTFNKNFIYRGDDWLFAQRWEMLIANRSAIPFTEVVTWNDFGESHYIGPIEGTQPMSQQWVNGFDHQGWLDLMQYYITAYKNGSYPAINKDRVFLWARPFPANITAPDPVGKPANWQWTQDYLWAVTMLTAPANVTLSCGTTSQKTLVPAGLSKLKLKLSTKCGVQALVMRNTTTSVNFAPSGFTFNTKATSYNFNAYVAASPA